MAKNKKKRNWGKIVVVVGLLGGLAWWLYKQAAQISIGGATARVHKLTLDGVELRIVLAVVNPTNTTIDVQNFLGQLYYKNASQGIVQQLAPVKIAPFAVGNVEFKTTISFITLGLDLYGVFENWQNNQGTNDQGQPNPQTALVDWAAFRIQGTLRAENILFPVNTTIFV